MTDQDREKWDVRYMKDLGDSYPSTIVKKYWQLASGKNALDIACGNGRNSLFLAEKGFTVDAVDISTVATDHLTGRHSRIHAIRQDIDTWNIAPHQYDLIVDIRFLDRRLFPMIKRGLKAGGVLIFESFIGREEQAYCLIQNELLRVFQPLRIIFYEEKKSDHSEKFNQIASLVAIKPDATSL